MTMTNRHLPAWIAGIAIALLPLVSCDRLEVSDADQMEQTADSFSTAYFNWHFADATAYVDSSSQRWLVYAASNVHQADVDALRAMEDGAQAEIEDIEATSDSAATVTLTVRNFLAMDTIGEEAHVVSEARFALPLRLIREGWRVSLSALPAPLKNKQ